MKRFVASAKFPFVISLVLAGVTAGAFAILEPTGTGVANGEMIAIFKKIGWAIGPVAGVLTWVLAGILNLLRRMFRLRKMALLDPIIVLLSIGPWLVLSWNLTGEPRFTNIAMVIIDFAARPLLWGSVVAALITIAFSLPLFLSKK